MSIRQQMLSILRGERTDRLPFAPRLDLWYAAKRWTGSLLAPNRRPWSQAGFLLYFGQVRRDLGLEVTIHGGPNVVLLRGGTPEDLRSETRRILESGVLEGGRFVLRGGNSLAPRTALADLAAMDQEARRHVRLAWSPLKGILPRARMLSIDSVKPYLTPVKIYAILL